MLRMISGLAIAGLVLTGCGAGAGRPAEAAARLIEAARKDDHAAFEAGLDRAALRADLRDQVTDLGRGNLLDVDGGPSEFTLDRRVTTIAVRALASHAGLDVTRPAQTGAVGARMRSTDGRHACLAATAKGPCLLSFTRKGGAWKLTGLRAADLNTPAPAHE